MIRLFEDFNKEEEIRNLCSKYNIKNYTINGDYSVDVDGDVNMVSRNMSEIPIKFNNVNGSFYINGNYITSLKGCPKHITGTFNCSNNKLQSLNFGPEYVGVNFISYKNSLTDVYHCPKYIGEGIDISNNKLTTLAGLPDTINGYFQVYKNDIVDLIDAPTTLKNIDIDISHNNLPMGIIENETYIKDILKYQKEYNIWNSDRTLNIPRFNLMMNDIIRDDNEQ